MRRIHRKDSSLASFFSRWVTVTRAPRSRAREPCALAVSALFPCVFFSDACSCATEYDFSQVFLGRECVGFLLSRIDPDSSIRRIPLDVRIFLDLVTRYFEDYQFCCVIISTPKYLYPFLPRYRSSLSISRYPSSIKRIIECSVINFSVLLLSMISMILLENILDARDYLQIIPFHGHLLLAYYLLLRQNLQYQNA